MYTYQDLALLGGDEKKRIAFISSAINAHKNSQPYKTAAAAEQYYQGENPTIMQYEKLVYDLMGRAHRDLYTANHKIASRFFGFVVDQEVSYLLGNGISFSEKQTKEKLGADFDQQVMRAAREALIGGTSFGIWAEGRMLVFPLTEFVPLYDEENGMLRAGIRWWQIDTGKPLRATLYEEDGYTEFLQKRNEELKVLEPKRPYRIIVRKAEIGEAEVLPGEPYPGLPIAPLKNGDKALSEIVGKQNTIDALDLASSSMVNGVDEGNLIFWVLTNCGGMDQMDDARFIESLKTIHVAHTSGDGGEKVEAHPIETPFEGTSATIDMLRKKLYEDFQAFDASAVTAGQQTATAIKASYVPLDLKTDKFEACVTAFILRLLELAGIKDKPSYTRNQIVNRNEEVQTLLLAAQYYDEEYIVQKLLTINGDADQYEELMRRKAAEEIDQRFSSAGSGSEGD
nr:MAG TPA: PORTAL PROTEIN [Caudoviricetes sp.]